jgi:chorismate lyase
MLLSDGSVTRHLQLLTDINVTVNCFEQREIGTERTDLPSLACLIPGPSLVQRQVMLHNGDPKTTVPYVYAASWWSADTIDKYLKDKQQPIWVSLSEGRAELYREILGVECGGNEYLEE